MTNDLTASSDASGPDEPRNADARGANDYARRVAEAALAEIIKDLCDRSGIGDEWDQVDVDVRNAIMRDWRTFIVQAINGAAPPSEQDKADAARYRWLRQDNADALYVFEDYVGDELDAAIDAAMKEQAATDEAQAK